MILHNRDGTPKCSVDPDKGLLSVSDKYKLYHALAPDGTGDFLLRIPNERSQNGQINFEAEKLRFLDKASRRFEQAYQEAKGDPEARVHYDWLFPELFDSFITDSDQGSRQINLLRVRDAGVSDFVPLAKLQAKYCIDAKTCTWILGRFFKLQTFLEHVGSFYVFHADQVILEPKAHRMVYLDWSEDYDVYHWDSVNRAASSMLSWLKFNDTPEEQRFADLLRYFVDETSEMRGEDAHRLLYQHVEEWWGYHYYPFTYFDKDTNTWLQLDTGFTA